jgi:peptide/nickel transport system substrate-binding protein
MRWTRVVAAAAVATMGVAACGSPSANNAGGGQTSGGDTAKAAAAFLPDAKGPAPEIAGAKKGGTLIISYAAAPETMDPSANYYQDTNGILKLTNRSLTAFALRAGKTVLVPDLATDLGQVSADKLTWTFKLKPGMKYEDGTPVVAGDIAYAAARSLAHEELPGGPTYQDEFLKGGDTYKGPYKDPAAKFAGAEAPDAQTVVFHLAKPMQSFPYFASFTQFSPIPKAKDNKDQYTNHPMATGPYMFKSYTKGEALTLVKNPNWDPASDAARHQFPDSIVFKFATDTVQVQNAILASNGADAATLNWDGVDATLVDQVKPGGPKEKQLVVGGGPCVSYFNLDTRKIPFDVRMAIAVAYPYDQINKATGQTPLSYSPASTISAPEIPGMTQYKLPYATGAGKGDPVAAKALLTKAGKVGFEISYYYSSDRPTSAAANEVRKQALTDAGFVVKPIGMPRTEARKKIADPNAPVNTGQGPAGWCYDWPAGDSIIPPIMSSKVLLSGQSVGFLSDAKVDADINRIMGLKIEEQGVEWAKLDKDIMTRLLPCLPTTYSKENYLFGTKVHNVVNDVNIGLPDISGIWVDQ